MLPQQYCLRWKYHHSNLQTMFSQLLDRGCFCDVTLACEGQLIRAHRVVLCACSSFFDTVLTNYASERDPIIIMKDVTFADVKCLIEFMYKGEINVEHANLASLLKTADDLKIKGLAEVSWRDDDDGPPLPTAATEFHSPTLVHDLYGSRHEQQRAGSPSLMDQQQLQPQQLQRERKLSSPKVSAPAQQRLPTLTPIPSTSGVSMAAAAAAAAAAAVASVASPAEHYLGPKRKRGRPPLDDAYDVFNVRKLAHYGNHIDAHHHHQHQAYLEAQRHYNDEQRRLAVISPIPPPSVSSVAAAAAYHQHIQQQQHNKRMRQLQRQQQQHHNHHHHHHQQQLQAEADEAEQDDVQADPEWITSNLEVNVGADGDSEPAMECGSEAALAKEQKSEIVEEKETNRIGKIDAKKRKERSSEEHEKLQSHERSLTRKRPSAEERDDSNVENSEHGRDEQQSREHITQNEMPEQPPERLAAAEEEEEQKAIVVASVPQPVEEMESVRQSAEKTSSASANNAATSSIGSHKRTSISSDQIAPPPSLHHTAHAYSKYVPEGYLLNEHGMLMTHDFVHAPTAAIPSTGATTSSSSSATAAAAAAAAAAANGNDQDYVDIKMEEYDGTDLRLTTEEMSEWQDVIKMDDYLAKGRRPQFWEEPFTRRVLDAIKNKRLEMKKAARILGVSYGTLYGRYREVYGCLKHPYSSTTFRPTQSNQLAVQPRFDMVWPSPKRDSGLLPGQLGRSDEIGKIRPKDLSELWTRPQI